MSTQIRAASIKVFSPTPLRRYCDGRGELFLRAADVGAVLAALELRQPELHRCVCDETGAVRRHINLFVNDDHIREHAGVETSLRSGDIVTIMTAVSGG
jgi:molybdopterin synthase sulfur carrier subunit